MEGEELESSCLGVGAFGSGLVARQANELRIPGGRIEDHALDREIRFWKGGSAFQAGGFIGCSNACGHGENDDDEDEGGPGHRKAKRSHL